VTLSDTGTHNQRKADPAEGDVAGQPEPANAGVKPNPIDRTGDLANPTTGPVNRQSTVPVMTVVTAKYETTFARTVSGENGTAELFMMVQFVPAPPASIDIVIPRAINRVCRHGSGRCAIQQRTSSCALSGVLPIAVATWKTRCGHFT
jgi:hypothetical protein